MLRVGVTGGAGAGKSTVTGLLAREGFPVVDADRVAHELYVPGSRVVEELVSVFGAEILLSDGTLDRAVLAEKVFGRPEHLGALDRIVHPPLLRALERRLDELEAEGVPVGILEAALLLQWGPPDFVNLIVGVVASRERRYRRLVAAGLSEDQAERRLESQADFEDLPRRVDIVIDNDGDLQTLRKEVRRLARALRQAARTE
jgi:dephospho-CoA kinase